MNQSHIYGIIGSALACLLLLLILLFVKVGQIPIEEEEGIAVSFGDTDFGGGFGEVQETTPTIPTAPPPTPTAPTNNDLLAQEDEESLAIDQQREEERKAQAEAAEKLRQQQEKERLIAEQIAREKAEAAAEQKRKEQEAIDKAKQLGNLFGSQPSETGSGNTSGAQKEGNPVGKGTSGGNSWSLNGRNLSGRLIQPNYDNNVEGDIIVHIRVNADGRVVSATIGGGNIADKATQNAAIKAAQSTRFTTGDREVTGSITYKFRLR